MSNVIDYQKKYSKPAEQITEAWRLYELGVAYNNSLSPNQYDLVNTNIEFFIGNQWRNLPMTEAMSQLAKPVFNVIKRVGSLFVAALTSSATTVNYEPLQNRGGDPVADEGITAAQMASAEVRNLFDKFKMEFRIREALFDGVQTGDYCAHFYWDPTKIPYGGAYGAYRGEICMELVDGINVMFGNPNTHIVEDQPYILIVGRDTVENLRAEYKRHHPKKKIDEADNIQSDTENQWQAASGGKLELISGDEYGKALYVYMYRKVSKEVIAKNPDGTDKMEIITDDAGNPVLETRDGELVLDEFGQPVYKTKPVKKWVTTVHVSKHTRSVTIFDDVDTGMTYYPIAWGNWERQKNQYHGRALVTGLIPNQIYINSMFSLVMRHQQQLGFPKILHNGNYIPQWDSTVGQSIAVWNLPDGIPLNSIYSVIQPADMSTQIMSTIQLAIDLTKESLGATDAQLGNVRPDNTSALIALQSASQVPLENPMANKYEWVEDIGRILLDMMGTYYGERPVVQTQTIQIPSKVPVTNPNNGQPVSDPETGAPMMKEEIQLQQQKVVVMYDFSKLKHLWFNIRADVGASTYWSRIAIVQTLDNLLRDGLIDIIEYFERMPDEYIPMKEALIDKRKQMQSQQAGLQQPGPDDLGSGLGLEGSLGASAGMAPELVPGLVPGAVTKPPAGGSDSSLVNLLSPSTQAAFTTMPTRVQNNILRQAQMQNLGGIV
jgi:hypothetical protein